jgi:DNA-binding NtrC family response regulator
MGVINKMSDFSNQRRDPQRPKVLVADDEDHFRGAMKKKLTARGYHVIDVKTGSEAIRSAVGHFPEVVIIDQHLPDISGQKVVREIKKKCPEIRAILLAGYGGANKSAGAKETDVFKNLHKPCGIKELIDTIEAARRERAEEVARLGGTNLGIIRRVYGWLIGLIIEKQRR